MTLAIAGLVFAALAGFLVRRVAERLWHLLAIVALAVPLLPLLAATVTADVSRWLPASLFAGNGKDDVVIASAAATVLFAVLIAAAAFGLGKAAWRRAWRRARGR